jgi:hypothetical protein
MSKTPLHLAFFFLLLACQFIGPHMNGFAAEKQRLVILDLPYLDLREIGAYPNLQQLVSAGSTGLVRVPLTPANHKTGSFIQPIIGRIIHGKAIGTFFDSNNSQGLSGLPVTVAAIHGGELIHFKAVDPKLFRDGFSLDNGFKNSTAAILRYYRLYRDRAVILVSFHKNRFRDLAYFDFLVSRISAEINFSNTLLMICSSCPPSKHSTGNSSLNPLILKGLSFSTGLVYSTSTRKRGILTLHDLYFTVGKFLKPDMQTGFPLRNAPGQWRAVAKDQHSLTKNYAIRWPLLTAYGYLLIGVLFLLAGCLLLRLHQRLIKFLFLSYLFLITMPAVFLLEAPFDCLHWIAITVCTLSFAGILFLGSYFLSKKSLSQTLGILSFLTAGTVLINGLFNGYFEYKSFLGYSIIAGARYYGVGNEYMGILIGSYIVGISLMIQRIRKWRRMILWCAAVLISIILIHPYFGADVGGGITAVMGLGITNYLWLKQPVHFKEVARLSLLTLLIVIFMGILDLYIYKSSMSHLGKLFLAIRENGLGIFFDLVIRKISLNLRLISSAPMTIILIGIFLTAPFLYRYPPAAIKKLTEEYPGIISGFAGLSITALIGLLANDSGIVSAAMIFLFGIGLILLMIVKERFHSDNTALLD